MPGTDTATHTCSDCGTEYRSFATYTRSDACYLARRAAREADAGFDVPEAPAQATRHYGKPQTESFDHEPQDPGVTSNQYGTFSNHTPTEKQMAFLTRLCAERDLALDPAWVRTKSRCSDEIDRIIKLPKPTAAAPDAARRPNRYAAKCIVCSGWVEAEAGFLAKTTDGRWAAEHKGSCPAKAEPQAPAYEPTKGDVHVIDGEYYRVHQSQGTGRFYAARFEGHGFEYAKGAIARVTADNKITAEQAAAFGHMHHRCCFCSLQLDTPESTAVGYGPKCAIKHDLPWGGKVAAPDADACQGGTCEDVNRLCPKHQAEYQDRYGRASNE